MWKLIKVANYRILVFIIVSTEDRQAVTATKFHSTFFGFRTSAVVDWETVELVHVMFKKGNREGCWEGSQTLT